MNTPPRDEEPADEDALTGEGEDSESPAGGHVTASIGFQARANLPFPVVGIGASAGGVSALTDFFGATRPGTGIAYIVVQHLPPEHQTHMPEILTRHTSIPVVAIEDGMAVQPDHIYVILPGSTLTLSGGRLHLGEPVEKRGHRRPVDDFFRSLADEQKEKAIGVILSGMGTNGTAGAQAIKAAGGLCIAQDPEEAEFSGMPSSLIHSGYADEVLRAAAIPPLLDKYTRHPYVESGPDEVQGDQDKLDSQRHDLNQVLALIRTATGHQFGGYKKPTLLRRIQRRMGLAELTELKDYAEYLRSRPEEASALANDLMINVTGFFRDEEAWEALRSSVIEPLVKNQPDGQPIRVWVAACASGEEAYTMAMLLVEEAGRQGRRIEAKIFATDTADRSLELARAGIYPGGIEGDISLERLDRFFYKEEHTYRINKAIRDMVVFAPQDVLRDPPFSRVDICACRNLLIYLEPEAQRRVLALLHFALRDGGYLFLGNAETLGRTDVMFETLSKKWRIYQRIGTRQHRFTDLPELANRALRRAQGLEAMLQPSATPPPVTVQKALMDRFIPPTVVVDGQDRIMFIHGDVGPFLTHPAGEPTRGLFDHVRVSLRPAVRLALRQAAAENREVAVTDAHADLADGKVPVTVLAAPFLQRGDGEYIFVSFSIRDGEGYERLSASASASASAPASALREPVISDGLADEVQLLQRELQATGEAFEASNEELKAANEEVTSINEELQSTNEELETSKEELQSLNEELITVNNQLQVKVGEVEGTSNDLTNLLGSIDIAVIFLDAGFRVRRYTQAVNDLLELIPTDVGRPVTHLAHKFDGSADMLEDARAVLERLVPVEREMASHSGRWYLRRILPYRTTDNRIDGVVIVFIDISGRRRAEESVATTQARLRSVIEQMPTATVMVEAPSGRLILANRRAAQLFGHPFPLPFLESEWQTIYAAFKGYHEDGRPFGASDWPLARTLATGESILDAEVGYQRADGSMGVLCVNSTSILGGQGQPIAVVSTYSDITERKHAEQELRESEERFRVLVEHAKDYAILLVDTEGRIRSWNSGAQKIMGWTAEEIIGRDGAELFTPEDRQQGGPEQEMKTARLKGAATDERWHLRKDGSRFWGSGVMNAVRLHGGQLRGFVKIMRDTTDAMRAKERLEGALLEAESSRVAAEEANRAKDDFIATVSHELRTPLNTMRLWASMLIGGKVSGQQAEEGLQTLHRAALAQGQIIEDLLDVSRMSSGRIYLALRDISIAELLHGAVAAVRPMAEVKGVVLKDEIPTDLGRMRGDPERLQQVLWNLLSNATKFTPKSGRVTVQARRTDEELRITVIDTGIGIPAKFLPQVFQRFSQAEGATTRRQGGLGLGLSIAKQLAEMHGGDISAHSEGEGRGARFVLRLPIVASMAPESRDGAAVPPGASRFPAGTRVLLVEDEPDTRAAVRLLLEAAGAAVTEADSAAAARAAYAKNPPDLLLSDIGMAGEDGYQLLQRIRAIETERGLRRVPALALTAFAGQEDRSRALAAGFDEHLGKPLEADVLIDIAVHVVGRK